jgi:hypothetical protein
MDDYCCEIENQTIISDITEKTVSSENSEEFGIHFVKSEIALPDFSLPNLNHDEEEFSKKDFKIIANLTSDELKEHLNNEWQYKDKIEKGEIITEDYFYKIREEPDNYYLDHLD